MGTWKKLAYYDDIVATKLDDFATPDDNTDLNASNARHGLLLKLIDDTTKFLRSDGTFAVPAGGGATLTIAETQVFSGNAPTTWTDLDLHTTIGSQATLVLLKVSFVQSGATGQFGFRRNGDGDEMFGAAYNYGAACITARTATFNVAVVVTDTGGIIEWKAAAALTNTTVDVIGYIK